MPHCAPWCCEFKLKCDVSDRKQDVMRHGLAAQPVTGLEVATHQLIMLNHHRTNDERDAFKLLVSPYHPDTLRYPASGAATAASDRLRHALTWNVFKTLEQIAPSVWMRPLVARSTGLPDGYSSAPHITAVTCWSNLQPAPRATLRRGRRNAVPVSAI